MSLLVPFDGSPLSKAALVRAVQFDTVLNEGVIAVCVIPRRNVEYARSRGWLDDTEGYDTEAIVTHLRAEIEALTPGVAFDHLLVDRHAPRGTIANRIRRFARDNDATIVFLGSENAGRIVDGLTVGQSVAGDRSYDTFIVTSERLPEIETLEEAVPSDELRS